MRRHLPLGAGELFPGGRNRQLVSLDPIALHAAGGAVVESDGGHEIDLEDLHVLDVEGEPGDEVVALEVLLERFAREYEAVVQDDNTAGLGEVGKDLLAGLLERAPHLRFLLLDALLDAPGNHRSIGAGHDCGGGIRAGVR